MKRLEEKYASLQIVSNIEKLGSVKVIHDSFLFARFILNLTFLALLVIISYPTIFKLKQTCRT